MDGQKNNYIMEDQNKNNNQFQIELKDDIAQGTYSNLAVISHSSSEFVLDFIRVVPGVPKHRVQSRVIMAPEHAKRLLRALLDNVNKYEANFGEIHLIEDDARRDQNKGTYMPPLSEFKGEA